jgi:hypothetical protein
MNISVLHKAGSLLITGLMVSLLSACGGKSPVSNRIQVEEKGTARVLDSARVVVMRFFPESVQATPVDTQWTDKQGRCEVRFVPEKGYQYRVVASRRHFRESLNANGATYDHEHIIVPGDTGLTRLLVEPILPPTQGPVARTFDRLAVGEVVAALRGNVWKWPFLPNLHWDDIPALLEIGGDTTLIDSFPHNPRVSLTPKKVRAGLAALWLAEAVRKREIAAAEMPALTAPSNYPVLGTAKAAPAINSPAQVALALKAYQDWWAAARIAEDRKEAARNNPLKSTGLGWR